MVKYRAYTPDPVYKFYRHNIGKTHNQSGVNILVLDWELNGESLNGRMSLWDWS